MLDWLIGTSVISFPFLIPVVVLMIGRIVGYQWRIQRLLVSVAIMFYAVSLFGFIAHTSMLGLSLQEFFNAYYGKPEARTVAYYVGLTGQALAVITLMFVVNWKVVRLFKGEDWKAKKAEPKADAKGEAAPAEKTAK
ncbi:MAG: hypothetical protein KHX35_08285 [Sutterella wadsworthensis]|nr:hypothetical protein [Sutterella wadsworthensis]